MCLQTLVCIVGLGNIEMFFNTREFTIYSFSDYSELRRKRFTAQLPNKT